MSIKKPQFVAAANEMVPMRAGGFMLTAPPEFNHAELQAMHRYCLKYRDLYRSGGTPTREQDEHFMRYQAVAYKTGVAHER